MCSDGSPPDSEERSLSEESAITVCIYSLRSDLWTEEAAVRFVPYPMTHNYYSVVTQIGPMLMWDWCYVTHGN